MINPIVKTIELGDGRTITLETGKLAKQADGAVMLRMSTKKNIQHSDVFPVALPNAKAKLQIMKF